MKNNFYVPFLGIFSISLLGSILRIYKLGAESLWYDEACFLIVYFNCNFLAKNHLLGIIKILCKRIITGGYAIANHAYVLFAIIWSKVTFGSNEFMIRLPSAICGIAAVFLIYKLGSLLFDKKTGLISAFILAISPFHIYYSQEFRMYSFITLLTIASVYSLIQFLKNGKNVFLISYIIFSTLNIYSHITTILIVIAEIFFILVCQNKYKNLFKKLLLGHIIIFIFLLPELLLIILWLKTHPREVFLGIRVCPITEYGHFSFTAPLATLKNFCIGYNAPPIIYFPATMLSLFLLGFGMKTIKNKEALSLCVCCLFIPIFIMFLMQKLIYADRYLIPSSIFLYLFVGNKIKQMSTKYIISILAVISILCSFSLFNYYKNYLPVPLQQRIGEHSKKEYKKAANYIIKNFRAGDFIGHVDLNTIIPFEYYFLINQKGYGIVKNFMRLDDKEYEFAMHHFPVFVPGNDDEGLLAVDLCSMYLFGNKETFAFKDKKRIWLVFSAREFEEANRPGSYQNKIADWLGANFIRENTKLFRGVAVYLYIQK